MKTTTIKSILVAFMLLFTLTQITAQDLVGIRIDVLGSRYSDKVYLFSVPTCTRYFDNGWDGYKMVGTNSVAPIIYADEPGGKFQVDAVPNLHETDIAFKAGEDSQYTLSFYSENLARYYKTLYLVDLQENNVIDLMTDPNVTYTFNVEQTPQPVIRFRVYTVLPQVEEPIDTTVVVEDPVVEPTPDPTPVDTVVVENPVEDPDPVVIEDPVTEDPVVDPIDNNGNNGKDGNCNGKDKDKKDKKDKKQKSIKICVSKKTICIDNVSNNKGRVCIINARTGRAVKDCDFNKGGCTRINANIPAGTYIIRALTKDEETSIRVVL